MGRIVGFNPDTNSFGEGRRRMLGPMLLQARTRAKLTLKETADKTGTSFQYLSKLERNQGLPSIPTLRRLDKVLHLPSRDLLRWLRNEHCEG